MTASCHFTRHTEDRHFKSISDLTTFIFASQNSDEMYLRLTEGVCAHSEWDLSGIQVLDLELGKAIPLARYDRDQDASKSDFSGWDADISPAGQVLKHGEPLILLDAKTQTEFPGYRKDAHARGYHTVVVIPLEVKDEKRRQMVYSVASRSRLEVNDNDISFLKCVAELISIAIRKMRAVRDEQQMAQRLREIVDHITSSLSLTLDAESAGRLAAALSGLFPSSWLAVDLTSGRMLFDRENPPPIEIGGGRRVPEGLITAALSAKISGSGMLADIRIDKSSVKAMVSALQIDGSHVGALFSFHSHELSDHEHIAARAGQLALSSFILRSFIEFKSRKTTSRRLLRRLFSHDWDKPDEILDEAHQLDFDLSVPCRILLLAGTETAAINDRTHSYVLRTAQQVFGPAISCVLDDRLAVLLSDNSDRFGDSEMESFLSRVSSFLPWTPLLVLSPRHEHGRDLAKSFDVCVNTMKVGSSMGASGWVSSKSVGEFSVLMATADGTRIEQFLESVIQPILAMGPRKSGTALTTIGAFLSTGRRYQETADSLGIHVSTLRYRLDQLSERYDLDFIDPEVCFELELAIRLHKLKNSYVS